MVPPRTPAFRGRHMGPGLPLTMHCSRPLLLAGITAQTLQPLVDRQNPVLATGPVCRRRLPPRSPKNVVLRGTEGSNPAPSSGESCAKHGLRYGGRRAEDGWRDHEFESGFLQQRVSKPAVPRERSGSHHPDRARITAALWQQISCKTPTSPSRDRWFESGFLQRRVRCELTSGGIIGKDGIAPAGFASAIAQCGSKA